MRLSTLTQHFLAWSLAVSLLPLLALGYSLYSSALGSWLQQPAFLAILMLTLLATIAGTFLFGRRITHPLKILAHSAEAVAGGQLHHRTPIRGEDEIGQLAGSFNRMAEYLSGTLGELRERIDQRTVELETISEQMKEVTLKRQAIAEALRIKRERLNVAQRIAQVGSWELDLAEGTLIWSDEIFRILEIDKSKSAPSFETFLAAIHPEDRNRVNEACANSFKTHQPYEIAYRLLMADGRIKYVNQRCEIHFGPKNESTRSLGTIQDISELKYAENKLAHLTFYDTLTGLPNRVLFRDRLEQQIADCRRNATKAALLFLDLDRFKVINDTLGSSIGDQLLIDVAERLKSSVRENDTVARLGGDEFAIILGDLRDANAAAVAQTVIQRLSLPVTLQGREIFVGASIGISLYPEDGQDFDSLTKNADIAMYHVKEAGRGTFRFFTEEMNRHTQGRLALDNSLHRALERGEFTVHYQPQADFATGRLVGAEALIRWHHPERGMVSPLDFIPLAEENGMILPIGTWVLREVCRQIKVWREQGLPDLRFAVNLSPRQFRQEGLVENILGILREFDVPASALELEITESSVMENADAAINLLNRLDQHGLSIAIDDFGTGYSSLSYLKRFPVSKLKIDRSFVMDIPGDANDTAIAIAVIQLAKSLGLKVVAEGVETAEQRQFLKDQGCDLLQGYWYSKPLDAAAFGAFALRASPPQQRPGDRARGTSESAGFNPGAHIGRIALVRQRPTKETPHLLQHNPTNTDAHGQRIGPLFAQAVREPT